MATTKTNKLRAPGLQIKESALEPTAPPANQVIIYAIDNGAGKTKLMAKFAAGAVQQIAIQP